MNKRPLSENELRMSLRIATGATISLTLTKLFNWDYSVFFCIYPILLLAFSPTVTGNKALQVIVQATITSIEVLVIYGLFGDKPTLIIPLAFLAYLWRFRLIAQRRLFDLAAMSTVMLSMQLNYGSYPTTNVYDMVMSNFMAAILSVLVAWFVLYLIPDVEKNPPPPPPPAKDPSSLRHETLLGATLTTLGFIIFQTMDLQDTTSAQIATIVILFPLQWDGVRFSGYHRAWGTILGCLVAAAWQLVLFNDFNILPLVSLVYWITMVILARLHILDGRRSTMPFCAMTGMAIVFGQYLGPDQDLMYRTTYRLTSVTIGVIITLLLVFVFHRFLNRFAWTRHASHATARSS